MTLQPENVAGGPLGGLYIHIPFCMRKCPYCAFYSTTGRRVPDSFVCGLTREMRLAEPSGVTFDTIYLGGGTPSLLKPAQAEKILGQAFDRFGLADDVEITLEANPGTITIDSLKAFVGLGVNRMNLGVQSFDDERLGFLGRIHSAREAREAIRSARRAGIDNLGLDLMYGLPDQSSPDWLKDLREAVSFEPEHLSCYMLTYEEGTPLSESRDAGRWQPLDEGKVSGLFRETVRFLRQAGYDQYEISNFSRGNAFRSRHNQKYWHHAPYMGLGPSAHSFLGTKRWWNHDHLGHYLDALQGDELPVKGSEKLSRDQLMLESVFLGLRTCHGVRLSRFQNSFGVDFLSLFAPVLDRLEGKKLLQVSADRCVLTLEGMVFADAVSGLFARQIDF